MLYSYSNLCLFHLWENAMLTKLFLGLNQLSPTIKRGLWRQWYQFLAGRYPMQEWTFMNYGYAPLDNQAARLALLPEDEADRCFIQLYHHVASGVDVAGLDVVEVGSGRGGGASYIARYLKPKTMLGIDFSEQAVRFSNRQHRVAGLSFSQGDAEKLPLDDAQVDVVINVESSHCYGSIETFLSEVQRILRPQGYFLYADFRGEEDVALLHRQLHHSGMTLLHEEDITANVVRSLELDNERKVALIQRYFPKWLLRSFQDFAGVKGSKIYEGFRSQRMRYKYYLLQK
jgi:ubiquinone/menaquinone biosynthesis C-methylase UbiE